MILVMLLWCNISQAAITISCIDNIKEDYSEEIRYSSVNIILDNNGSVHVTEYATFVKYGDVWGWDDTSEYQKKVKALKTKKERRKFSDAHYLESNPLKKDPTDGVKDENFTSIKFKAGHKIRTEEIIIELSADKNFKYMDYYEIDLKEKTVKKFFGMTERSRQRWNSDWTEKDDEAGFKKVGPPKLDLHFINCKTSGASGSTGDVASSGNRSFNLISTSFKLFR